MDRKIKNSKQSYTFRDMYRNIDVDIDYFTYERILDCMCKIILQYVLNCSEGFKMPYGLGLILVGKYRPKNYDAKSLSVDYKASKEYNKKIYHLNEHSDGYKFRLHWCRIPQTFPNRYKYLLNLVRANKRKLALLIFNKQDYIDINDIQIY